MIRDNILYLGAGNERGNGHVLRSLPIKRFPMEAKPREDQGVLAEIFEK